MRSYKIQTSSVCWQEEEGSGWNLAASKLKASLDINDIRSFHQIVRPDKMYHLIHHNTRAVSIPMELRIVISQFDGE